MPHDLIMPKQTSELDVFYASLEILYESKERGEEWCSSVVYKDQIVRKCTRLASGTVLNGPFLVKQSELVRYFGLGKYDYHYHIHGGRSQITERGIRFYKAYKDRDENTQRKIIMEAILNDSFGRNNTAIKNSNSDIDPPKLFIKAINDLGTLTRDTLSYLLYVTHDSHIRYEDALTEVRASDAEREIPLNVRNKYHDVKFTSFLRDMGIVFETDRKFYLSQFTKNNFLREITQLSIYNSISEVIYSMDTVSHEEPQVDEDVNQEEVLTSFGYDINSTRFLRENNRTPEPIRPGSTKYKTNPRISKTALQLSDFKCEIDKDGHITFMAKIGRPFMEAHHLVPMKAQKDFSVNLDRVENIVSLCPNCHSAIHLGNDATRLDCLRKLYEQRVSKLRAVGINISFGDLFSKYYQ